MRCRKHPFDRASDICSHCGGCYCAQCLVRPRGTSGECFCVECAVQLSVRMRRRIKRIRRRHLRVRRAELATWLSENPHAAERMVELAPIHDVPEDERVLPRGTTKPAIEWVI